MKNRASLLTIASVAAFALTVMAVDDGDKAFAGSADRPTVVELFTSQSCYSCPPAEQFLGELSGQPDIVALEFHVDYWDQLVYGSSGAWKDPYSKAAYSERQRRYAGTFKGGSVYTPQMVIDGRRFEVGSQEYGVRSAIKAVNRERGSTLALAATPDAKGGLDVRIDGSHPQEAGIWLVRFIKAATNRVRAGENRGKTLTSHNIVLSIDPVGRWTGEATTLKLPKLGLQKGEGCALIVQGYDLGPVLGATYCPAGLTS